MKKVLLLTIAIAACFTFTACGKKGTLTITNIPAEYKGRFIAGEHVEGTYVFSAVRPVALEFWGKQITGSSAVLNVYHVKGNNSDGLFTGADKIYASDLVIILSDEENVHDVNENSNMHGFINTKLITLKNGSAKINLIADMKKL